MNLDISSMIVKLGLLLLLFYTTIQNVDARRFHHAPKERYHNPRIRLYNYRPRVKYCSVRPANSKHSNIFVLPNGQVDVGKPLVGATATFTCNDKFTLCGYDKTTCTSTGQWNRIMPTCVKANTSEDKNVTVLYGNSKYFFSKDKKNFTSAQAFCESLGGNLVAINSKEEQEFISCVVLSMDRSGNYAYDRFIGLTKIERKWVWINGEELTFTNWFGRIPTRDVCGGIAVVVLYEWLDYAQQCSSDKPFICEMNL